MACSQGLHATKATETLTLNMWKFVGIGQTRGQCTVHNGLGKNVFPKGRKHCCNILETANSLLWTDAALKTHCCGNTMLLQALTKIKLNLSIYTEKTP